jgi:metallophosphoesterase (TIGR00282 family)
MAEYTILFLGDVVGRSGRDAVKKGLPHLKKRFGPLFTIVNGENSAGGVGITPAIAGEFFSWGADGITLGNHAFNKREIGPYLDSNPAIVRPYNMPAATPGRGVATIEKEGISLTIINLCGRIFMDSYDDPFGAADKILSELETPHRLLDFHAEATSEKIAMGYHCDGRASLVVGTHTHVQTADESVLSGGTAYITDVGMCGPKNSVLGMDKEIILKRFRTTLPQKFQVSEEEGVICGVSVDVDKETGRSLRIERFRFPEE